MSNHLSTLSTHIQRTLIACILFSCAWMQPTQAQTTDLNPKSLLVYWGYPRSINQGGAGTVPGASAELGQYDYLVWGANHEQPTHWDYANTKAILEDSAMANTTVFGEVSVGVNVVNHSLTEVQTRIDQWKTAGAEGIFFNHFGYNWGADRQRQNDAIQYAHDQNMLVLVEAFFPADAFGNAADPVHNPNGTPTVLNASDFYFYDAHQVANGDIYAGFIWQDKADQLQTYRDSIDFGIFSYTTNNDSNVYDEAEFSYSYHSALLYGHEATGWGEYANSGWGPSAEQAPYRNRPVVNPGTTFTSDVLNPSPDIYTRTTDLGIISVNTATGETSFANPPNNPPALAALNSQTIETGQTRHIAIAATDPDGSTPSLSATNVPAFATFVDHGTGAGTLSITPGAADTGSYTVEIAATDAIDPALTDIQSLDLSVETPDLTPKSLLIYNAYPRSINQGAAGTVETASPQLGQYDYLVLSGGHEKTDHWDYANTKAILDHAAMANTTVFGEVSIGVNVVNHSPAEIQTRINQWKDAGAEGIFLNHFGYNWSADRQRQNDAIDYARSQGMLIMAEAFFPADAFGNAIDPQHNPGGIDTHLNSTDIYLYEAHQVANGTIYEDFIWQDRANQVQAYQNEIGFDIFSYTTNADNTSYDEDAFFYSYYSALLYGHRATGWGEYAYSGWGASADQAPLRQRPIVDPGTAFIGEVENPAAGIYRRQTDTGVIAINTTTHIGWISHHAPLANAESYSVDEDATLTIAAPGLLANDSDADGETLTAIKTTNPSHGAVYINADGSFTYAPDPDFSGSDSFSYQVVDPAYTTSSPAVVSIAVNYVDGVQPDNLAPKKLLIYYGWTSKINGTSSVPEASAVFGAYDYVIFGGGIDQENHPEHQYISDILAHPNMVNTTAFGYIELGLKGRPADKSDEEMKMLMEKWQALGMDGIFLDEFDYGGATDEVPGVTRLRQNSAVGHAHSLGMPVVANAFVPEWAFSSEVHPMHNPTGEATRLDSNDFYLYESHQVGLSEYTPAFIWTDKANRLKAYHDEIHFNILSNTTVDDGNVYDENAFFYSWYSALLYGHEATAWGQACYSACESAPDLAPFRTPPAINPGTVFTSEIQSHGNGLYTRQTDIGTIAIEVFDNNETKSIHADNGSIQDGWISYYAPMGIADAYSTDEDQNLAVPAPGVLANDSDEDSESFTAVKLTDPAHGIVQLQADGSFVYVPEANFSGSDSFAYQVRDRSYVTSDTVTATITINYVDGIQPESLSPKTLLMYSAYPRSINQASPGSGSIESASAELGQYDYLVLGAEHERPGHWEYANTKAILAHPDMANTTVFGEIALDTVIVHHSLNEIQTRIDEWKEAGAEGIFFSRSDYAWGVSRDRQNTAVDYARSQGMSILIEAATPADLFGAEVHAERNSNGTATSLNESDFYLYNGHQFSNGSFVDGASWDNTASALQIYRDSLGFEVFSYTTNSETLDYDEADFFYSWYSALLYGHEATGWGEFGNSAWGASAEQAPFRTRPASDPGTIFLNDVDKSVPDIYTRQTDTGTICVNTLTREYAFIPYGQQSEDIKLIASSGGGAEDRFGSALAQAGDRIVVGAYNNDDQGTDAGTAYVYRWDGAHWLSEAQLYAQDANTGDNFGYSVSIDSTRILVGARYENTNGTHAGAAYVFDYDNGSWSQTTKLLPYDGVADAEYGDEVKIQGNRIVIGAHGDDDQGARSGSVYYYEYDNGSWLGQPKLTAYDGAAGDLFGWSIALDGDRMVVSSREDDDKGINSGSAYIFEYNGTGWAEPAKITAEDGDTGDGFAYGVALNGDRVVIGSFRDDDQGTDAGAAYIFDYDSTNDSWNQRAKLVAIDGGAGDYFGGTVSLQGDRIVVSADAHDGSGADAGAAYVFEYDSNNGQWDPANKITPDDIAAGDRFGWPVSLQNDRLVVGSFFDDDQGGQSGSAYVINLPHLEPNPNELVRGVWMYGFEAFDNAERIDSLSMMGINRVYLSADAKKLGPNGETTSASYTDKMRDLLLLAEAAGIEVYAMTLQDTSFVFADQHARSAELVEWLLDFSQDPNTPVPFAGIHIDAEPQATDLWSDAINSGDWETIETIMQQYVDLLATLRTSIDTHSHPLPLSPATHWAYDEWTDEHAALFSGHADSLAQYVDELVPMAYATDKASELYDRAEGEAQAAATLVGIEAAVFPTYQALLDTLNQVDANFADVAGYKGTVVYKYETLKELYDYNLPHLDNNTSTLVDWIVGLQYEDAGQASYGAIKIHHDPGLYIGNDAYWHISPYHASLAVVGLLRSSANDKLQKSELWFDWYLNHLNANGTVYDHWYLADGSGETTAPIGCGTGGQPACDWEDATDSNAATFLGALWTYYQEGGDANFITDRKTQIETVAAAILNLQQPDGLTWAKSSYPVQFLMDNSEVYWGLQAIAELEQTVFNAPAAAQLYTNAASGVMAGINTELFNVNTGLYRVAKLGPNSYQEVDLNTWYPDIVALAWPHLFGIVAGEDDRTQAQIAAINNSWNGAANPDWTNSIVDPSGFPWTSIGYAALLAGNTEQAHNHADFVMIQKAPDFAYPFTVSDAGWLLRTYFYNEQGAGANFPNSAAKGIATSNAQEIAAIPDVFALHANYPNPFNPSTTIAFALPEAGEVELAIYNIAGQRIATLVSGYKNAGRYQMQWDARNVASGVYFYRLQAAGQVQTRQMTLVK